MDFYTIKFYFTNWNRPAGLVFSHMRKFSTFEVCLLYKYHVISGIKREIIQVLYYLHTAAQYEWNDA